jgi:hypothetical protein
VNSSEKNVAAVVKALETKNTDRLTEEQILLLNNLSTADDIIRLHGIGPKACDILCEKLGIQKRHAYDLIADTQRVFGSRWVMDKKYWRGVILDKMWRMVNSLENSIFEPIENIGVDANGNPAEVPDDESTKRMAIRKSVDPKLIVSYSKIMHEIIEMLQLQKEDLPFDPREGYTIPQLSMDPKDLTKANESEISEILHKRLIALGAKLNDDGEFE